MFSRTNMSLAVCITIILDSKNVTKLEGINTEVTKLNSIVINAMMYHSVSTYLEEARSYIILIFTIDFTNFIIICTNKRNLTAIIYFVPV